MPLCCVCSLPKTYTQDDHFVFVPVLIKSSHNFISQKSKILVTVLFFIERSAPSVTRVVLIKESIEMGISVLFKIAFTKAAISFF